MELEYVTSPRVFVLIVANEYRITLHNLLQTLKKQGYSYKVLQFGTPWTGFLFLLRRVFCLRDVLDFSQFYRIGFLEDPKLYF